PEPADAAQAGADRSGNRQCAAVPAAVAKPPGRLGLGATGCRPPAGRRIAAVLARGRIARATDRIRLSSAPRVLPRRTSATHTIARLPAVFPTAIAVRQGSATTATP